MLKKIKFQRYTIPWILLAAFLSVFFLSHALSYHDYDFGWHLKIGQEIVDSREVPRIEDKLWPIAGAGWVDHEWLSNAAIYGFYAIGGYFGLALLFSAVTMLALAVTLASARILSKKPLSFYAASLFLVLGSLGIAPHSGIRVQAFTVCFLALELLILAKFDGTKKIPVLFWLIPLFWLWVNLHGGFLIGFAVITGYLLANSLESPVFSLPGIRRLKKSFDIKPMGKKPLLCLALIALAAFAATFLNPYGPELYGFLGTYSDTYYLQHVNEWLPAFNYPIFYHQLAFNIIAAAILVISIAELFKKNPAYRPRPWILAMVLVFFLLAFLSRRNFPLFFVASFPFLLNSASRIFALPGSWNRFLEKNRFLFFINSAALLLLLVFFAVMIQAPEDPFKDPKYCRDLPCESTLFLQNYPGALEAKMLNVYGWGGYLVWVWPEKKLFLDGRLPIYPYNGHSLLAEYGEFFQEGKAESKLAEHGIELVQLRKFQPIKFNWFERVFLGFDQKDTDEQKNRLEEYLDSHENWEKIFENSKTAIYKLGE